MEGRTCLRIQTGSGLVLRVIPLAEGEYHSYNGKAQFFGPGVVLVEETGNMTRRHEYHVGDPEAWVAVGAYLAEDGAKATGRDPDADPPPAAYRESVNAAIAERKEGDALDLLESVGGMMPSESARAYARYIADE